MAVRGPYRQKVIREVYMLTLPAEVSDVEHLIGHTPYEHKGNAEVSYDSATNSLVLTLDTTTVVEGLVTSTGRDE